MIKIVKEEPKRRTEQRKLQVRSVAIIQTLGQPEGTEVNGPYSPKGKMAAAYPPVV